MTNGDFIRSMSDADIRENFTQLLCEFVQRKQTSRCRSRELYGNPRMDTMVDAARALNAVVTITPKGVTIRARKESA